MENKGWDVQFMQLASAIVGGGCLPLPNMSVMGISYFTRQSQDGLFLELA